MLAHIVRAHSYQAGKQVILTNFKLANMYAYVKYIDDGCKEIVHINAIKEFQPSSVTDFQPGLVYQVRWRQDFFKAQILLLKGRK